MMYHKYIHAVRRRRAPVQPVSLPFFHKYRVVYLCGSCIDHCLGCTHRFVGFKAPPKHNTDLPNKPLITKNIIKQGVTATDRHTTEGLPHRSIAPVQSRAYIFRPSFCLLCSIRPHASTAHTRTIWQTHQWAQCLIGSCMEL